MRVAIPFVFAALAACSSPQSGEPPLVEQGREIAQTNCAACHALDATSDSPHADAPPFRTLSDRYPIDSLQEALAEGIVVGHPDMPEFSFAPEDVDALIAFIESLQTEH